MNFFQRGNEMYNTKDYRKAIELYKRAYEERNNEAAALYNAAVCFIKLSEYDKALPLLERAIVHRRDSKYFFNLGYCYAMLKNNKKALIYFNTAWALDPSDGDCKKAIDLIINGYKLSS